MKRHDLKQSVSMLVGMLLSEPEINLLIDKIFQEIDSAEKGYIDKEDFQKVMWMTDFDQKCSIFFT